MLLFPPHYHKYLLPLIEFAIQENVNYQILQKCQNDTVRPGRHYCPTLIILLLKSIWWQSNLLQ